MGQSEIRTFLYKNIKGLAKYYSYFYYSKLLLTLYLVYSLFLHHFHQILHDKVNMIVKPQ